VKFLGIWVLILGWGISAANAAGKQLSPYQRLIPWRASTLGPDQIRLSDITARFLILETPKMTVGLIPLPENKGDYLFELIDPSQIIKSRAWEKGTMIKSWTAKMDPLKIANIEDQIQNPSIKEGSRNFIHIFDPSEDVAKNSSAILDQSISKKSGSIFQKAKLKFSVLPEALLLSAIYMVPSTIGYAVALKTTGYSMIGTLVGVGPVFYFGAYLQMAHYKREKEFKYQEKRNVEFLVSGLNFAFPIIAGGCVSALRSFGVPIP
jgi:hypothetical protein